MSKRAHIYVNYKNVVVLQGYLEIIKKALSNAGFDCDEILSVDGLDKKDLYVFPMGIDAFRFYHRGYRNFLLWQQGATADESYMRNKSKIRYWVLNDIDCFAMKKAKMVFFCSQYMKEHYERKAHCSFADKAYLMPCYNEELSVKDIEGKDYTKKHFTYAGSLDLWQCFDEIASIYKSIEEVYPDAYFKVLTFSVREAERIIESYGIKNYVVKSVSKDKVQEELKDMVFGFVIREDSVVNRVATPTKLSSYMSVGVIPIFSTVLDDFNRASKSMQYVIAVDKTEKRDALIEKIGMRIDREKLKEEYVKLFDTYYGTENHINAICEKMKGLLQ